MSLWVSLAQVATATSVVLLLALSSVWVRNYRQLRSKHTLGMLVFALLLLVENAFALYVYLLDPQLSAWFGSTAVPDVAWHAMLGFHVLEALAVGFLTWVTFD